MKRALIVSHRFGGFDGVSVEADKWRNALTALGWSVTRAAGRFEGKAELDDVTVDGMWSPTFGDIPPPVDISRIAHLCSAHDLVILDNLGTLWTMPLAAAAWESEILRAGVPAIVRHHDPPWQTPHTTQFNEDAVPLRDPRMLHVTINELTRTQFAERWPHLVRNNALVVLHNTVDICGVTGGDRDLVRTGFGLGATDILVLHPARNIARKNTTGAQLVAAALDTDVRRSHYWLTDPAGAIDSVPLGGVHRGWVESSADMYAAADLVVLPSIWEGWGLPVVEAAAAGKLVVAGPYPVLDEIRGLGITVYDPSEIADVRDLLHDPDRLSGVVETNAAAAAAVSISGLPEKLADLIRRAQSLCSVS